MHILSYTFMFLGAYFENDEGILIIIQSYIPTPIYTYPHPFTRTYTYTLIPTHSYLQGPTIESDEGTTKVYMDQVISLRTDVRNIYMINM